jgi:hypothetical protein
MIIGSSRTSNGAQLRSGAIADREGLADARSVPIDAPPAMEYTVSAGARKIGANVEPVAR